MRRIVLILLLFFSTSSAFADDSCAGRGTFEWLRATAPAKGKIMFVHGLNSRPDRFKPLMDTFRAAGFHTLLLTLSGHHDWEGPVLRGTSCEWRDDVQRGLHELHSRYAGLTETALGYSMGGALLVDAGANGAEALPPKIMLLAPAIKLTFRANILRSLLPLTAFDVTVKSIIPKYYREHRRTALTSYVALRDIVDGFAPLSAAQITKLQRTQALIMISPDDQLVSFPRITWWLKNNELKNWELQPVTPDPVREETSPHIIADERSLGSEAWEKMQRALIEFVL